MESCGQACPRSRSPYTHTGCPEEFLRRKQLEINRLLGYAPKRTWKEALERMRERPEGPVRRFNRERREREAKEALRNNGEPRLIEGSEPEAKKDGSLWGTVSF